MSKKPNRANNILLPGLEEFDTAMMGNFENDPTLESELMAILGGTGTNLSKKSKVVKRDIKTANIDKNLLNLDIKEDDDIGEIDENDPELLAELNDMLEDEPEEPALKTPDSSPAKVPGSDHVKTLENLKQLYQAAIKESQSANDTNKKNRYERSLKSIENLLRKAVKGDPVNESDFPPPVFVKANTQKPDETPKQIELSPPKRTPPPIVAEKTTKSAVPESMMISSSNVVDALIRRQLEYKSAAVAAKSKDVNLAKGLMVVIKQFDQVIAEVRNGVEFDLVNLPPPPSQFKLSDLNQEEDEEEPPVSRPSNQEMGGPAQFGEELKIRRQFYAESIEKAKAEDNAGKVRRLARVVQQYEEALVAYGKKAVYNYEELPAPPGKSALVRPAAAGVSAPAAAGVSAPAGPSRTVRLLQQRQSQFKSAALKAKTEGDLPLAKELLRQAKGFDQMIEASESGLPVDLAKIPSLPTEVDPAFTPVAPEPCATPADMRTTDRADLFAKLQTALLDQMRTCLNYQQRAAKAGDVLGAKRFESLSASCQKDLDGVRCLSLGRAELPAFHYECKLFSLAAINADLGESELSVDVVRATDLPVPAGVSATEMTTYVVVELPLPSAEAAQTFQTEAVRHTNCPEYAAQHKFAVLAKSRGFARAVKTKAVRADVWLRRGLLQKDRLLGTTTARLDRLERSCTVHDAYDLREGRTVLAGKLELVLRLRSAVDGPQTDTVKEKWLVVDQFNLGAERAAAVDQMEAAKAAANDGTDGDFGSIAVLKYEVDEFRKKLAEVGPQVAAGLAASVRQKMREKEEAVRRLEARLASTADVSLRQQRLMTYLQSLAKLPPQYTAEAKKQLAAGNRDKAQSLITKKRIVETEMETLRGARK